MDSEHRWLVVMINEIHDQFVENRIELYGFVSQEISELIGVIYTWFQKSRANINSCVLGTLLPPNVA